MVATPRAFFTSKHRYALDHKIRASVFSFFIPTVMTQPDCRDRVETSPNSSPDLIETKRQTFWALVFRALIISSSDCFTF
jgi:hypothetical protein